jgi:hypothetical protein
LSGIPEFCDAAAGSASVPIIPVENIYYLYPIQQDVVSGDGRSLE